LQGIKAEGHGKKHLQLMSVKDGITYAYDISIEVADEYDGNRVWIYRTKRHNPDWMK
jgi:hypothetical protein